MNALNRLRTFSKEYGLVWVCVVILVVGFITDKNFFSYFNLNSLFYQIAILGLLGIGQAIVILTGGIDLSIGNVASMTTVMISWAMIQLEGTMSNAGVTILSLLIAAATALVLGLVSGVSVAYLNVPPIIATLGTMWIAKAIAFYMFGGQAIPFEVKDFQVIGNIDIGSVPLVFFIFLAVLILIYVLLTKTKTGRSLYAMGGNEFAAFISGIKTRKLKISAYLISALFASVAGIVIGAYTRAGYAKAGDGYELVVIAAVVIAGFSMAGGKGNIINILFGVMMLRLLAKLLLFIGMSGYLENLWVGIILIVALVLSERNKNMGPVIFGNRRSKPVLRGGE